MMQHHSVTSTSLGYITHGGGANGGVSFGSLTVNQDSATPYSDATQVSLTINSIFLFHLFV